MLIYAVKPYKNFTPVVISGHSDSSSMVNFEIDGKPFHCVNREHVRFMTEDPENIATKEYGENYVPTQFFDDIEEVFCEFPDADIIPRY